MKDILEKIKKIVEDFKKKFGEEIIFTECTIDDDKVLITGSICNKEFIMTYTDNEFFRIYMARDEINFIEDELMQIIIDDLNIKKHFSYKEKIDDDEIVVMEWDTVSYSRRKRDILNHGPFTVAFYEGNSGHMKMVPGLFAFNHNAMFVPLPEEQRMTEEGLINLERRLARSAYKNEMIQVLSYKEAEKSNLR